MNRDNAVQRDIDHVPNTGVEVPAYRKKHLRNRIEGLLNASSPQPLSPKIIALRLGANHSAVKKAVQREMNSPNPRFYRVGRGLYQGTAAQNETVPISQVETLGFHAIKLEARCPQVGIGSCPAVPLQIEGKLNNNGSRTTTEEFRGRVLTITIHPTGLVETWVKCSDEPLTVDEFELLCERLRGRFPAIPDASWYLVQLGVNVDIPNLRIDGFQSLSLSAFENGFLQVYEKNRGTTRVEAHFLPSLELQDVIQTLLKLLPSGERQ